MKSGNSRKCFQTQLCAKNLDLLCFEKNKMKAKSKVLFKLFGWAKERVHTDLIRLALPDCAQQTEMKASTQAEEIINRSICHKNWGEGG